MTGAEAFVAALEAAGTEYVFGNPGSTELGFLDAVGRSELEYVTCLHEAVAVGAAEGYARVSRRPGVVQLHTVAGVGNAAGMLANARAGGTPIVAFAGCPARADAYAEPVLGGDPVAVAAPVSKWAWELRTAQEIPAVVARAFKVAATPPCGPVVLVGPADVMAEPCTAGVVAPSFVRARTRPDPEAIREAAKLLLEAEHPLIVVGDGAAASDAGAAVASVAELLAAPIYSTGTEAVASPRGAWDTLPLFDADTVGWVLGDHDVVLAVGTPFLRLAAPSKLGRPRAAIVQIGSDPWELAKNWPALAILADEREAMLALAAELEQAEPTDRDRWLRTRSTLATDGLTPDSALAALAAVLPEEAIVVDESVSAIPALERQIPLRPGGWFRSRGGALGAGMAMPLGAALAAPERPVVAIVGDGSAMYTSGALWSYAQRRLRVTVVVLDNGGYGILDASGLAAGLEPAGTRLDDPPLDFCALAAAHGVAARRVDTVAGAAAAFGEALAQPPSLVHVVLDRMEATQ